MFTLTILLCVDRTSIIVKKHKEEDVSPLRFFIIPSTVTSIFGVQFYKHFINGEFYFVFVPL